MDTIQSILYTIGMIAFGMGLRAIYERYWK